VGLLGFATILTGAWTLRPGRAPSTGVPEHALARPGREVFGGTPAVRPAQTVADEIDHPFREAWCRAGSIEADLHRRPDPQTDDSVSTFARSLADRAAFLEREIASGPSSPNGSPFPKPFDRR
jgi:hypothetical protein